MIKRLLVLLVFVALGVLCLQAPPGPRDTDGTGKLIVIPFLVIPVLASFWIIRALIIHLPVLTISKETLVIGGGSDKMVIPWTHIKAWHIQLDYYTGDSHGNAAQLLAGNRYSLVILTADAKPIVPLNGLTKGVEEIEALIMTYKPQEDNQYPL